LQPLHQPSSLLQPAAAVGGSRTIFIQTENTPNPDALKFLPNHPILPPTLSSPFLEYLNPRSTLAPPHPSPLAASLMNIDGITSVFYGADFITVTKAADANWAHVKPEVFSLITEAVTSGAPIVNITENKSGGDGQEGLEEDSLSYNENDSEVVGMIKELLETRIRPAIQEDGGDIEFRGFEDGNVMLKLRGACRTCDSSTVTLKNGIEGMLMHYVSLLSVSARVPAADVYPD
jgi:Fe-S cluster biogenesis protein NfuA